MFNTVTVAGISSILIHKTDINSVNRAITILGWLDGYLYVTTKDNKNLSFLVSGSTESTNYITINLYNPTGVILTNGSVAGISFSPAGPEGPGGANGNNGATGPTGATGSTGPTGSAGFYKNRESINYATGANGYATVVTGGGVLAGAVATLQSSGSTSRIISVEINTALNGTVSNGTLRFFVTGGATGNAITTGSQTVNWIAWN
jgi:hypothetical protein